MQIGLAIKLVRELRGMSGKDLSNKTGISAGFISLIETGKRTDLRLSNALAISNALEISLDKLINISFLVENTSTKITSLQQSLEADIKRAFNDIDIQNLERSNDGH